MKGTLTTLNTTVNLVFIGMMVYLILMLSELPAGVYEQLHQRHILVFIYLIIGIGAAAVVLHYVSMNATYSKEVVYVDRIVDQEKEEIRDETTEKTSLRENMEQCERMVDQVLNYTLAPEEKFDKILSVLCNQLNAGQGIAYRTFQRDGKNVLKQFASYAYVKEKEHPEEFEFGVGLAGMAAKENRVVSLEEVPENYLTVLSGLGKTSTIHLLILPLQSGGAVVGIIELALLWSPGSEEKKFFSRLTNKLGDAMEVRRK